MARRIITLSIALIFLLGFSLVHLAQAVPKASTLKAWLNDSETSLASGADDILGWDLDSTWISTFSASPTITMDSYTELGMVEIGMNNHLWPTGDEHNKFYNPSSIESNESLAFRQAVAYLIDRDSIVRSVLGGYGYKMDVPLPPQHSAYMDTVNNTKAVVTYNVGANSYQLNASVGGITYPYNPAMAAYILDKAGFTMLESGLRQNPRAPGWAMNPVKVLVPSFDTVLNTICNMVITSLKSVGIPVSSTICPTQTIYLTHLWWGGSNLFVDKWTLNPLPTEYYDLYSSYMYYPSTYPLEPPNYAGFCNNGTQFGPGHSDIEGFDYWAQKLKYASTVGDAMVAAKNAGYLFLKYCPSVPLYCSPDVKAYKTGWTDLVNGEGYGIDNYWSFLTMANPLDTSIDYGLKGGFGAKLNLNIITYGTTNPPNFQTPDLIFDETPKAMGLMYESMMGTNPFNQAFTEYWIANASSAGSWDATAKGGDADATCINFTIRPNVYWHNSIAQPRRLLDIQDVNFTFYYVKACGSSAWNFPLVADFDHTTLYPSENKISICYTHKSCWALMWAGSLPIVNRDVWSYVTPEDAARFDPTISDVNSNGVTDIYEDGTGAWQLSSLGSTVTSFKADSAYYLSTAYITGRIAEMFYVGAGDVNRDVIVNMQDLGLMARALFTTPSSGGTPGQWGAWNPNCDFNNDGIVNGADLSVTTSYWGRGIG